MNVKSMFPSHRIRLTNLLQSALLYFFPISLPILAYSLSTASMSPVVHQYESRSILAKHPSDDLHDEPVMAVSRPRKDGAALVALGLVHGLLVPFLWCLARGPDGSRAGLFHGLSSLLGLILRFREARADTVFFISDSSPPFALDCFVQIPDHLVLPLTSFLLPRDIP